MRDKASGGSISGVYTLVHEHFEPTLNAVSCRLGLFQYPLVGFVPVLADISMDLDRDREFGRSAHQGDDLGPHFLD